MYKARIGSNVGRFYYPVAGLLDDLGTSTSGTRNNRVPSEGVHFTYKLFVQRLKASRKYVILPVSCSWIV